MNTINVLGLKSSTAQHLGEAKAEPQKGLKGHLIEIYKLIIGLLAKT